MYDVQFEADGNVLRMNPDTGIIVGTISGQTGVTAALDTVQATSNVGVSVTGGSISGKNLTVKGIILDGNTNAKQQLLDFFKPMRRMTMQFNSRRRSSLAVQYRQADVYVKVTPTITQEKHSKFTIGLYMPMPFFAATSAEELEFDNPTEWVDTTILGDTPPFYEFTYSAGADTTGLTIYASDGGIKSLYLDFTKLAAGKVARNEVVRVWCDENGRIRATVNNIAAQAMLYTNSTLFQLPIGQTSFRVSPSTNYFAASIKYTPLYSGVLNDDV